MNQAPEEEYTFKVGEVVTDFSVIVDFDDIKDIGLLRYDEMLADLSGKDIKIRAIYFEYDEIDDSDFDCLEVEGSKCVWFLSTRWVTKVGE